MKQYVVSKELVIYCFSNEEIRHFLSKRILTKNSAIWQQDVFIYLLIICTGVKYSPKITSIPTVANRQQCIQSQHDLQQRLPGQTLNFFSALEQSPGSTSAESAGQARPRHDVSCAVTNWPSTQRGARASASEFYKKTFKTKTSWIY